MIISNIVVADAQGGIGRNNQLLVHFPADLKHFKKLTTGHPVLMGRKTYESMGKALPNRRNIVITRQAGLEFPDAEVAHSLEDAVNLCRSEEEIFVIGGAEIFRMSFPMSDRIYLTRIRQAFEADTFLPEIDPGKWTVTEQEDHQPDEKNPFAYSFLTYVKS
ncbi:MAG TPA: dihydrofolate reductase [Sphingobacteriaceae bacterium]